MVVSVPELVQIFFGVLVIDGPNKSVWLYSGLAVFGAGCI